MSAGEPRDTEARNQGQPSVFGQPASDILRASPLTPPGTTQVFNDAGYMPEISESESGSQAPIEPRAHIFWDEMADWPDNLPGYSP